MLTKYHNINAVSRVEGTICATFNDISTYCFIPTQVESTPAMLEYPDLVMRFYINEREKGYYNLRTTIRDYAENLIAYKLQLVMYFNGDAQGYTHKPICLTDCIAEETVFGKLIVIATTNDLDLLRAVGYSKEVTQDENLQLHVKYLIRERKQPHLARFRHILED